jgi:cell division protein FtsL
MRRKSAFALGEIARCSKNSGKGGGMKLMKPRNFVTFALAALSGVVLMHTSQSVQQAENRLAILQSSIAREKEQMHILKAEWESLNRPDRLENLAKKYLDLQPPKAETVLEEAAAVPAVPEGLLQEESPETILQPASAQDVSEPQGGGQ